MTSAAVKPNVVSSAKPTDDHFDPENYRMTLGDHLEELRRRMILGLSGFFIAAVVCLIFGEHVMAIFCRPLVMALMKYDINPQMYFTNVTDPFVEYMQISLICAAVIAGPWLIYQIWAFVRAGLFPNERKTVTKYIPFSIGLLISGMLFLYFFILPISLDFLIHFGSTIPLKMPAAPVDTRAPASQSVMTVPVFHGDPPKPQANQIWVDDVQNRLKVYFNHQIRVVPFGPQNLMAPMITLPEYIDLVLRWLIIFGISFQLPLVVMGVGRIGLVDIPTLKKWRRIVYFIITVISAVTVPDVVTGMIAMMVPMAILYEMGIWLAARAIRKAEAARAAEEAEEAAG